MKIQKRWLSALLAVVMILSLVSGNGAALNAYAEEFDDIILSDTEPAETDETETLETETEPQESIVSETETEVPESETEPQESTALETESEDTELENVETEDTNLCAHHKEHTPDCGFVPATEGGEGSPCTYECRICPIEELIAALPDEVTADNAEDVKAQLEAIDEAKAELTDEELDQLDITRYIEAAAALGDLDAPVLLDAALSGTFGDSGDWSWTLDADGTLTITGTGDMPDWTYINYTSRPWNGCLGSITKVVIGDGVTSVGDCAFYAALSSGGNQSITSVVLPDSLTSIGEGAFDGCNSLASINLPDNLVSIGNYAFSSCTNLSLTALPAGLTSLGKEAFCYCENLALTELPAGITSIPASLFYESKFTSQFLTIHSEITEIGDEAFRNADVNLIFMGAAAPTINRRYESGYSDNLSLSQGNYNYVPARGTGYSDTGWTRARLRYWYDVTVDTEGSGTAVASQNTIVKQGVDTVTLTATPQEGWHFKEWQAPEGITITDNQFTIPEDYSVQENITITAVFDEHTWSEDWITDDTAHWHECTFAACDVTSDYDTHTPVYTANGGTITGTCGDCQRELGTATITATSGDYNGSPYTASVSGTGTMANMTWDIAYKENDAALSSAPADAGSYTASISIGGATASADFTISQADGGGAVSIEGWTYGDTPNSPVPESSANGTDNVAYLYTSTDSGGYSDTTAPVNAGSYKVTATFAATRNYKEHTASAAFTISPKDALALSIEGVDASYTYTSNAIKPEITVKDGSKTLTADTDYTVSYGANTTVADGGSVTITMTNPNYTGSQTVKFAIVTVTYTVTLETNGGTIDNGKDVNSYIYGDGATLPTAEDVTRTGYTFMGWYEDSSFSGSAVTEISGTETGNKTFYAKWEAATYTVTLNANGGTIASGENVTSYTYGEGAALPTTDDMTRAGYTFTGWYQDSDFSGSAVTEISDSETGNKTFYAKWEANTYTVTLNTNGGTIADGKEVTSYTYGEGVTLPTADDMTRTGYMFMGWYADSSFSGSAVTEISDTETGDKTFYAKWAAPVAEIVKEDGTAAYVTSLTDAFTYENRDITVVTLLEDVDVGSEYVYIREWNTCTLDLNGHTVSSTGVQTFFLIGGNLTIKDSKSGGIISAKSYAIYIDSGTLFIESGTVSGGCGIWHDGGKVTISGGTIIGSNGTSISTTSETDTLKDMLAEGCAYYQDGVPVPLDANSTYLLGTVTVKECSHTGEGVCEYTHIDGATTHSKTCLACGYTEAAEDCQYTFADNVGTCQACGSTLTVTVTGTDGLTYDGTAKTLPVEVKVNNTAALTAGIDYTVTYANNTNAGEASVIVADKDGAWNFEQKFTIAKATVTITWTDTTQSVTYTGSAAAITAPTVSAENDLTVSTVPEYSYAEELSTEFKSGLPSDAGTYTVRASIAESDNLSAASADMMLIITPPENTVSVDITWGAMSFTYTDGAWDPDTHTNGEGGWTDGGSGWISVENSGSNVPVEVNCTYNTARTDISGSFTDGTDPVSEPVTLAVNETKKLWLILSGKPDGELDHTELGTVTVSITGGGE